MPAVFVSHAMVDRPLVEPFVETILQAGCGLRDRELFYSSGAATRVPNGANLNAYLQERVANATLVIAIITPAFSRSRFCLAELGAAWARAGDLFPLALPGMTHETVDGVLTGLIVRSLDDGHALDELADLLSKILGRSKTNQKWGQQRSRWLENVSTYVETVKPQHRTVVSATACSREPGHMELFWTDGSGRVFFRWWLRGRGWSSITELPGPAAIYVAAVSREPGDEWLFGMVEKGRVWAQRWLQDHRGADRPGPIEWIEGDVLGPLSAVRYGNRGMQISAWTADRNPCFVHREDGQWTRWSTDWSASAVNEDL